MREYLPKTWLQWVITLVILWAVILITLWSGVDLEQMGRVVRWVITLVGIN